MILTSLIKRVDDSLSALRYFTAVSRVMEDSMGGEHTQLRAELVRLRIPTVDPTTERIFRHCTVVTRLYAVYEDFCEALLAYWLSRVPKWKLFAEHSDGFQKDYRTGIARILNSIGKRRYRHLQELDVLEKYLSALRGETQWEVVPDAYTVHEANLRKDELERLFRSVGLDKLWAFLERDHGLSARTGEGGANRDLGQWILDLVSFRNDAAHGRTDEILGLATLEEYIDFVEALCHALFRFMEREVVAGETDCKKNDVFTGEVLHSYKDNIIIVRCHKGTIRQGEQFYFLRDTDCTYAQVQSIQVDNVDLESAEIPDEGLEVGIKTDIEVGRHSKMVRISRL